MTAPVTSAGDLVARLDKAVDRCKAILGHDTYEGLNTDFALMAQYRLSEAAARIQELEAALKPFADAASAYDPEEEDDQSAAWQSVFDIGDLRRARSSLNQDGGKP